MNTGRKKRLDWAIERGRAAVEWRVWTWVWSALSYLLGLLWFGVFFEWGKHGLFFHDWADITGPRWQFLRMAVLSGQLPLHISDPSTMHGFTVRYLSVPDTLISPQYLLLAGLSIPRFNLVNVWLLYTLGFAGLLLLRRKLKLSVLVFAGMALLMNFNGNLLAHYSVGHTSWGGTFLFPWFVWLTLRALEGDRSWKLILGMAATLTVIWLQGSFHQYLWLLIMVALLGVFVPRTFWTMLKAGVGALLLSAVRLFPAMLLYGTYSASFDNGYPSVWALVDYLVRIADPLEDGYFHTGLGVPIGAWELTWFVGLAGALALLYYGLFRGLATRGAPYRGLSGPLGVMTLLTMGGVFGLLRSLPIPIIQGERVSSRMISVVLAFLIVLAAERLQRRLDQTDQPLAAAGAVLLGLGWVAADLWQNLNAWRLGVAEKVFWWLYYDSEKWYPANDWGDTVYIGLVFGGLAVSLITLGVLVWLAHKRTGKSASTGSPNA